MSDANLSHQLASGSNNHPNPMFDFLTGFVPRKLKDLFRWTEYLFYNSPHIFIALTKLSDYIITDITYETDSKQLRKKYEKVLETTLSGKSKLKACARDRYIYGNSFTSMYFPFKRMLECSNCKSIWDIRKINDYEYVWKKQKFNYTCPACNKSSSTPLDKVKDIKTPLPERINIIRWDPKLIDIDYNPVTGESVYHYNIPSSLKEKVKDSDPTAIDSMPKEFLEAIHDDMVFEFETDKIYHMRIPAPAGVDGAWGFPPLTSTLKQFYYTQVLRKANEAIALDHLVPFRVLHPAQTGQNNDPVTSMAMGQWVEETKKNIKQWRQDPLHIQFAPVALGVTQMGGQGRTLLTLGEIKEAEENIIAGMGVPREFLFGGLSYTGSSVTLRMLENQLLSHKDDLEGLLQWIADSVADYMSWEKVETGITNFRFVDDVQQKSMLLQADSEYNLASRRTLSEMFDIDFDQEQEQIQQEMIEDMKRKAKTDRKVHNIQTSLAQQAQEESMMEAGLNYDPEAVTMEAEDIAMHLMEMEDTERRSHLQEMQEFDFVMYSVVRQHMQRMQRTHPEEEQAPQM